MELPTDTPTLEPTTTPTAEPTATSTGTPTDVPTPTDTPAIEPGDPAPTQPATRPTYVPPQPVPAATKPAKPAPDKPLIVLDPAAGVSGDPVTVSGSSWPAGETVLVRIAASPNQSNGRIEPRNALARVKVDRNGRFKATIRLPDDPLLQVQPSVWVVAATTNGRNRASAPFQLASAIGNGSDPGSPPHPAVDLEPNHRPRCPRPSQVSHENDEGSSETRSTDPSRLHFSDDRNDDANKDLQQNEGSNGDGPGDPDLGNGCSDGAAVTS